VVTGASSGIGWALAEVLSDQGAKVGLIARRRERLEDLAEELRTAGRVAAVAVADVGDRSQIQQAIGQLQEQLGPVDLLVANAGIGVLTRIDPLNVADLESMFRVNVLGVIYAFEAVLPEMLRRKQGHLAAISSLTAYKGFADEEGYCASKAAVNVFLEGLRLHVRDHGVAVTTICPGFVRTPMIAASRFPTPFSLEPEEAAIRIARALERRRKVYNFPLTMAAAAKLASLLPDWLVARVMKSAKGARREPPLKVE
jgi:short-subunit dehydrogenase